MSAIEVLANSKADHGLAPLGAGRAYVPVLCVATPLLTATTDTYTFVVTATTGAAAFVGDVGDLPSAGIPARGSARELLDFRSSSAG